VFDKQIPQFLTMNHQLIIPIIIPVFGLDGAGKTLLCRQLAAASSNDQNGHASHQLSSLFIPSSASHLLMPQQHHQQHPTNQPLLPFTTYPNFTKERLVLHHFSDQGKKESKDKSKEEAIKPTTMASPYQHRTTEMFTPPSATPQNRGALAIAGSNISSSSRPPSAAVAAADENPNFIPDSSPEKRRDEADDDSHVILAAASTTPRNRIQYHHQHENDGDTNHVDLFSPRVVQTVMKSPETKHEHENDNDQHQGKHETMSITRSFVIHLLDTAGSPLLRGSWLPIMNQHVILSSNNHNETDCDSVMNDNNTITTTKRFIFVISANDLMRVSFAWTEFLQFREKVRKLTTSPMKLSAAVVLFDDGDSDEERITC